MIPSPFYYQVQEIIKNDDDKALKKIFQDPDPDLKQEFNSYHEDFLHCTYPDSFKCLYFLVNDMNKRYRVHSLFNVSMKDNNLEWFTLFLETFEKKMKETPSSETQILYLNVFNMSQDLEYDVILNSSPEIWHLMFKHIGIDFFKPHMLVNAIFEEQQLDKLYLFEDLCKTYNFELPIKDILSKALYAGELDLADYFLEKYQPQFSQDDMTDLLNSVSLSGHVDTFKYFIKHFLPVKDFNNNQMALAFNAGLILDRSNILKYLKDEYNIDFYPTDKQLNTEFKKVRSTMWEDNDEYTPETHSLVNNINDLFNLYQWDKSSLQKEINGFSEIYNLFSKVSLNEKLQSKLEVKKVSHNKGKI